MSTDKLYKSSLISALVALALFSVWIVFYLPDIFGHHTGHEPQWAQVIPGTAQAGETIDVVGQVMLESDVTLKTPVGDKFVDTIKPSATQHGVPSTTVTYHVTIKKTAPSGTVISFRLDTPKDGCSLTDMSTTIK